MEKELLKVENIVKYFPAKAGFFAAPGAVAHALNGINFNIDKGEVLGLVGESGCGKSTLAKIIARLLEPTSGKIIFDGNDITQLRQSQLKNIRRNMQFIFQDPYASLNPRMNINQIISEPFVVHGFKEKSEIRREVKRMLNLVGLSEDILGRYPHEFSGGQRQRIGIARALMLNPKLIIADEPVASLDVSVQAQILNLLKILKNQFNLTYLFISHDLRIVEYMSDRVIVMYLGKIMEIADSRDLYQHPIHPYSEALLSAIPLVLPKIKKKRILLKGEIPSSVEMPSGCVFHTRCIYAKQRCIDEIPALAENSGRFFACHYPLWDANKRELETNIHE